MRYVVRCIVCGDQEIHAPMREAAEFMECGLCGRPRPQVYHPPQFQEDRTRLWRGPLGNGYSTALGERMPDSRAARDALARKKGIEFCSRAELLADSKEAADALAYHAHVAQGGARDITPVDTAHPWQAAPAWAKELT